MAMVGSILGYVFRSVSGYHAYGTDASLGDRHGENILLDSGSGASIHVDFNCLFDKVCFVEFR